MIVFIFLLSPISVSAQYFEYEDLEFTMSEEGEHVRISIPAGENRSIGGNIEIYSPGTLRFMIMNDFHYLGWIDKQGIHPSVSVSNITQYSTPYRWNWTTNEPVTTWHMVYLRSSNNVEDLVGYVEVWDYEFYDVPPITNTTIIINGTTTITTTTNITSINTTITGTNLTDINTWIGGDVLEIDLYVIGLITIIGGGIVAVILLLRPKKPKW